MLHHEGSIGLDTYNLHCCCCCAVLALPLHGGDDDDGGVQKSSPRASEQRHPPAAATRAAYAHVQAATSTGVTAHMQDMWTTE